MPDMVALPFSFVQSGTAIMLCTLCAWPALDQGRAEAAVPDHSEMQRSGRKLAALCSSSMMAAAVTGNSTQLLLSLQNESANCVDAEGQTPLHLAAEWNQTDNSVRLLAAGALMIRDIRGRVPLHKAALAGHAAMTLELLDAGAYIELEDDAHRRALHHAAFMGHTQVARLLLDRNAYISAADGDQRTALHLAVRVDGYLNTTELLISRGAEMEQPDSIGFRALHLACRENQPRTAGFLLDLGADLYAMDSSGWNPLVHAASAGHEGLVSRLVFQLLKPREFPTPDPALFEHQGGSGTLFGVEGWVLALAIIFLCGFCMIAEAMRRLRR